MKCPKCGKEMTRGALGPGNKGFMFWAKDEFFKNTLCNLFTRAGIKKTGGIIIPLGNGITIDRTIAWSCRDCEMVLIDCAKRH